MDNTLLTCSAGDLTGSCGVIVLCASGAIYERSRSKVAADVVGASVAPLKEAVLDRLRWTVVDGIEAWVTSVDARPLCTQLQSVLR